MEPQLDAVTWENNTKEEFHKFQEGFLDEFTELKTMFFAKVKKQKTNINIT